MRVWAHSEPIYHGSIASYPLVFLEAHLDKSTQDLEIRLRDRPGSPPRPKALGPPSDRGRPGGTTRRNRPMYTQRWLSVGEMRAAYNGL